MSRYTLCPYFDGERKSRITCEDTYRWFDSPEEKCAWMDSYCDKDWMKCPYAIDLNEAYERYEEGDEKALENHEIEALKKEMRGMTTKLGTTEKKLERAQKRVDELTAINNSFVGKNQDLEKQKRKYFEKWKDADTQLKEYERKIDDQIKKIVSVYEQRICFLIEQHVPDKRFYENDASAWAKDKAFALVYAKDENDIPCWKVVYGEENDEEKKE